MQKKIKIRLFLVFIICSFSMGVFFLLIHRNFLIIHWNFNLIKQESILEHKNSNISERKVVKFYFWRNNKFIFENKTIVFVKNNSENLKHLINNWLSFLHEVRFLQKKIFLKSVALSNDSQVFFLFDCNPLDREWSIFKKWNFFESMLKTIRDSNLEFKTAYFLVNDQFLDDDHLDLSLGYPIEGFLGKYY
ncbi:hypothetical protein ACFLYH_00550 [Candidatus Dependentiae bacterium]